MWKVEEYDKRAKKYGCDGWCYGCNTYLPNGHPDRKDICPLVDNCEETKRKEGIGTILAYFCYMLLVSFF